MGLVQHNPTPVQRVQRRGLLHRAALAPQPSLLPPIVALCECEMQNSVFYRSFLSSLFFKFLTQHPPRSRRMWSAPHRTLAAPCCPWCARCHGTAARTASPRPCASAVRRATLFFIIIINLFLVYNPFLISSYLINRNRWANNQSRRSGE